MSTTRSLARSIDRQTPARRRYREVQFISHGELRLAELKQLLARAGLQSEFADGSLIVNASVIVRKQGPRDVTVEGHFGADYLRVRGVLYRQFSTV